MIFLIKVVLVLTTIIQAINGERGRIYNGQEAIPSNFKYFCKLEIYNPSDFQRATCGSSLIAPEWVLTAAHCFNIGTSTTVFCGYNKYYDFSLTTETNKVFVHEDYKIVNGSPINDAALVKINRVDFKKYTYIQVISLPRKWMNAMDDVQGGETVTTCGVGKTASGYQPDTLQTTTLKVLTQQNCSIQFNEPINDNLICTISTTSNACKGDSGGPVVKGFGSSSILVGLVSYGKTGECKPNSPIAHTRVSSFLDWIQKTIQNN